MHIFFSFLRAVCASLVVAPIPTRGVAGALLSLHFPRSHSLSICRLQRKTMYSLPEDEETAHCVAHLAIAHVPPPHRHADE